MSFLKTYTDYANKITDAPIEFHQYAALATAGTIIGRSRYFQYGHQRIYPNFYILIMAPSSFYRKSTALSISREMTYKTDPTKVYPSDFSQEAMSEKLRDNPSGIFYWFEWKTLITMMSKDYMAGTKTWLTELFDSYNMEIVRKSASYEIKNPCVSILSATTSDWFLDKNNQSDIGSGFLARFLIVHSKNKIRNDSIPPRPDLTEKEEVERQLAEISESTTDNEMVLSDSARKLYDEWYVKFNNSFDSLPKAWNTLFARHTVYCLKIAMIIQTCKDMQLEITEKSLSEAIQYCAWLKHSLSELCHSELSFSKQEAIEKKILKVIKKHEKISQTNIMRYANVNSWEFKTAIQTLIEKQFVKESSEKMDGSRQNSRVFSPVL